MAQKRAKRRSITWWETELQRFAAEGTISTKTASAVMQAVERLATLEASNDALKHMNDQLTAARAHPLDQLLNPGTTEPGGALQDTKRLLEQLPSGTATVHVPVSDRDWTTGVEETQEGQLTNKPESR